jgi:hypothetical protein
MNPLSTVFITIRFEATLFNLTVELVLTNAKLIEEILHGAL